MPDYKEMYRILFRSQTKAIELLQKAQQITENMYITETETTAGDTDKKSAKNTIASEFEK